MLFNAGRLKFAGSWWSPAVIVAVVTTSRRWKRTRASTASSPTTSNVSISAHSISPVGVTLATDTGGNVAREGLYYFTHTHAHPHTHTILQQSWILSRTTWVSQHQKGKTNLDLLEQETVSGSDISWAICKSAPWPRYITTPASHHSVFTGRMPFLLPNQQRQSTYII